MARTSLNSILSPELRTRKRMVLEESLLERILERGEEHGGERGEDRGRHRWDQTEGQPGRDRGQSTVIKPEIRSKGVINVN